MKITDFKIIEANSIERLTELVKAELPAWSVIGSVEAERIPLTSPSGDGSYSEVIFRICLGLEAEAGGVVVEPQRLIISDRIIEGAEAERPLVANAVATKKSKKTKAKSL